MPKEDSPYHKNGQKKRPAAEDQNDDEDPFAKQMQSIGMFLDAPDDWHAGASAREEAFVRSLGSWINAHSANAKDRAIAEQLSKRIRYVTHAEFQTAFSESVKWAINELEKTQKLPTNTKGGKKFSIYLMASPYKSSAWLSKVAWDTVISKHNTKIEIAGCIAATDDDTIPPELIKNPSASSLIGNKNKKNKTKEGDYSNDNDVQHILFCDDASYSGIQINLILQYLVAAWERKLLLDEKENNNSKKTFWKTASDTHIYIAVPFMSARAADNISNLYMRSQSIRKASRFKVQGNLETGKRMTFKVLDNEKLTIHLNPVAPRNVMEKALNVMRDMDDRIELTLRDYMNTTGSTLTTFNHKTPDDISLFPHVRRGELIRGGKFSRTERVPFLNLDRRAYSQSRHNPASSS
jgi:hypothetical protein